MTVGSTSSQDSATISKGLIISTDPAQGSQETLGSPINFVLSTGKVDVPSVVGQSASAAGSTLSNLKLNYTVIADSTCSSGNVSAQSLKGEQAQHVSMTITVCTGS
jgi:beta-lactam-binding protein with PASTA domain